MYCIEPVAMFNRLHNFLQPLPVLYSSIELFIISIECSFVFAMAVMLARQQQDME